MTDKGEIRKRILAVKIGDTDEKSRAICGILTSTPEFLAAKSIFIYLSTLGEVATEGIISTAFELNKRVFVPVTDGVMRLAEISADTEYTVGKFGIRTPVSPVITDEVPDFTVVPMLGFDRELNRLGRGGGYYDRYLEDKNTFKAGLCFAEREVSRLPREAFDIKMDIIITEEGILS